MKNTITNQTPKTSAKKAEVLLLNKSKIEILELIEELAFQNDEKSKRSAELVIANKELAFQNDEKVKRADELSVQIADALKLAHRLEAHQIELEIMNTELILAKEQAEVAEKKYTELYDFAPSGYCSVSKEGEITELNLRGAIMLGKERSMLINSMFAFFLSNDTKPNFNLFLEKIFNSRARETCEVTLLTSQNTPMYIHLTGIVTKNSEQCLVTMVDFTRQKLAEKIIKESEMKFRTVADFTYDWEIWTGTDDRIIYISPSCERISGYKQEEFLADSSLLNKITHPGDATLFSVYSEQLHSPEHLNKIDDFDYRILKKDGSVSHIEHLSRSVFDDNGNYKGRRISNREITERKQIEEKLKQVSIRLDLATGISGVGVWDYSIMSNNLVWDDRMFTLYGINRKDFIGVYEAWQEVVHPDDKKRCDVEFQMAISGEKEFDTEFRVVWPDGSVHNIRALATVQRDDSGMALRMIGTNWDVTDLKITEEKILDDSEIKYRSIFHGSPDGMVLIDMKGIITEISEIGIHLFGENTRNDIIGKDIFQFVSSEGNDIFRELLFVTKNEGLVQNMGLTMLKKDHSKYFVEVSATLIQDQYGKPVSLMLVIRDVSQRKKMEAKQVHADRMSTLGEMAAGIAHEINQPLNIISLVMDKILFETSRTEIVNVKFLKIKSDKIFENITRIKDIIDHIRDFSRSQEGFINTTFDINSSITNAYLMMAQQFIHHGISLNLLLEPQIPQIVGNTYRFEQVILNLLANAKDAVFEKKKQQQDVEMKVEIRSWHEKNCIFVDVTDNGTGIRKDDIQNIMLPFYTTKDEGKGTGLGLSICYQIIKEMKGTIEITSERMLGAKFQLVLPLQKDL